MNRGRRGAAVLAVALAVSAIAVSCSSDGDQDEGAADDRPNILYIVADDMIPSDLVAMPQLREWLGDEGTSYEDAFVSVSLCCPSRVSALRGQYAHNTGVLTNEGRRGGFPVAYRRGLEESTVATWLGDEGYRTGLIGKYLNFYPVGVGPTYVPPGWDEWSSPVVGEASAGYDYTLNENGRLVSYGDAREDYAATVYVDRTAEFVTQAAEDGEPFFAWLAVEAPHEPATAAPEDLDAFADARAPRTPSFNAVDPDGPAWSSELPPLTDAQIDEIDGRYRRRLASLRSLDRELARLADVLDENGQLDDTYVVFTSDNGFHLGQHRLKAGKQNAYDEDIRVPLLVRGPDVPAGETSDAIVANVDLAPTFAALAGAPVPDFVDGRSLAELWTDPDRAEHDRAAVLLEHWEVESAGAATGGDEPSGGDPAGADPGGDTPVAVETFDFDALSESPSPPEYQGVRTRRYTYVEYVTGEVELFDNEEDPAQLHNVAATAPRELLAELSALVDALGDCAGASCRDAEATEIP